MSGLNPFGGLTATQLDAQIAAYLAASPTLVTPTIASFVNATHNHQSAAGGGTLAAAALASGTLANARLPAAAYDVLSGLDNLTNPPIYQSNVAPGGAAGKDVDIYTVASGKRALIETGLFNTGVNALTVFFEKKISGVYYRVGANSAIAVLAAAPTVFGPMFLAGESISLNIVPTPFTLTQVAVVASVVTYTGTITGGAANAFAGKQFVIEGFATAGNNLTFTVTGSSATTLVGTLTTQANETHAGTAVDQSGLNIIGNLSLFDDTSGLKLAQLASSTWTNGENTIYTCPANTTALLAGMTALLGSASGANLTYINQSGLATTIKISIVKSGQSPSQATVTLNNQNATVANNAVVGTAAFYCLQPGDFISLNTNQTGKQLLLCPIIERAM